MMLDRKRASMLGRERASVEEGVVEGGRVDEGDERGRNGTRHERRERKMGGREEMREEGREQGRKGIREGGKLQGRYPEEGTGQYTVYSQTIPQRGPCP